MMLESLYENRLSKLYLSNGYAIEESDEKKTLEEIKLIFIKNINMILPKTKSKNDNYILNYIHKFLSIKDLNSFRLEMIHKINNTNDFRKNFFKVSKKMVETIVGNELAMQTKINLSIQIPNDDTSLLPVHADTWSGLSPFETVVLMPLVDCYKTKSMFILPSNKSKIINKIFKTKVKSTKDIFQKIKNDIRWLKINYGQILIFDQTLPHGNVVNKEKETRWTMNCRFKGIFTPYKDKKLGEFYQPITLKSATKRGLNYKLPNEE
tara:strand:- start:5746 stop:6540 length:795 start_codon:yes stop_codon:yes gene_type:complete